MLNIYKIDLFSICIINLAVPICVNIPNIIDAIRVSLLR